MGSTKNVDMSSQETTVKVVEDQTSAIEKKLPAKQKHFRSKKYAAVRSQVDKTKLYDTFAAVELAKKLSYSKFDGTLEAHLVVKEAGISVDITYPHSTGKTVKVAIATDEILAQIEAGSIDFDVLVAHPSYMPKLSKLARVLGPKGLMPNPKTGTLTNDPEVKKKELEAGKTTLKAEKKAPLVHTTVGKMSMDTQALVENIQALLKAFKGKALKATISPSMGPGIKIAVE